MNSGPPDSKDDVPLSDTKEGKLKVKIENRKEMNKE
jgi:hypothetical protein